MICVLSRHLADGSSEGQVGAGLLHLLADYCAVQHTSGNFNVGLFDFDKLNPAALVQK